MEFPPSHRLWMYDRLFPKRAGLKQSFVDGVWEFILFAMTQEQFRVEGGIRCPCVKCECGKIRNPSEVIDHLKRVGFRPNYWIWTSNGEKGFDVVPLVGENCRGDASNSADIGCGEQINLMQNMACDGLGVNVSFEEQQYDKMDELPNEEAQRDSERLAKKMGRKPDVDWQPPRQDQPPQQDENEDADDGDSGDQGDHAY